MEGKTKLNIGPTHSLRTEALGIVKVHIFELNEGDAPGQFGITIVKGNIQDVDIPLIRVHSRCLYGEVFGSQDCDCRAQLHLAYDRIQDEGVGALIYLEQEGRGCGLISKAGAYMLKESQELDTVEAYRELGLPLDDRQYYIAAAILRHFGLRRVRLLTNNPAKSTGLVREQIAVEQVLLRTEPTEYNKAYLEVKQLKLGHDLGLELPEDRNRS